ncbi:hypothetical protein SDC9_203647 [bioreactor metagenome]|uniref:Uncharacterized protein n=1 Tax=bioreactor metagenome TaxID=1076179 RepID=A0A645J8X9_9ZZZZ
MVSAQVSPAVARRLRIVYKAARREVPAAVVREEHGSNQAAARVFRVRIRKDHLSALDRRRALGIGGASQHREGQ